MIGWLGQPLSRMRVRLALLIVAGTLVTAAGFYVLLLTLTREWIDRELTARSSGVLRELTREAATPLVIGDRDRLHDDMRLALHEDDVVGIAVYASDGRLVTQTMSKPLLWKRASWDAVRDEPDGSPTREVRRLSHFELRSLVLPVVRQTVPHFPVSGLDDGADATSANPGAAALSTHTVGYVRLVVSTARLENSMMLAARIGIGLVVLALLLALLGAWSLMRLVTRPLREASELARAIANGQLGRRLPVRSDDELGTLAESMNTMAGALSDSRRRELDEAATLRDTAEAMVAVGQSARASDDPVNVFHVVAAQVRRITGCNGVALAIADADHRALTFEHFDPPAPWGGLMRGMPIDVELSERFGGNTPPLVRLGLLSPIDDLSRSLARAGFRSALMVPLSVAGAPPAALLLVSEHSEDFPTSEVRVVTGLASHLSAALHAQQLNRRLEQAFGELQATQDQLVRAEKLRATGELAAGVAHDFNNVLGAILGRLQLLQRRLEAGELGSSELLDSLGTMELAARDGAETVRRLRQFGHGDTATAFGPVELAAVIAAAAQFTRPRWKDEAESVGRTIRLEMRCEPGVVVNGRASELREVFTNLILNSIDALPQGGTILLSARAVGDMAVAVVEDDGIGMSVDVQSRIFDPFFTTKGQRGTGLGLSVVYGIVGRMDGRLAVESDEGDGTRIELRLPLSDETLAESAGSAPIPAHAFVDALPADALEVMVVDDDEEVRRLLADICHALGQRPLVCASGADALREYEPGRFGLVLTDLGMPGMTGWELVRALREQDRQVVIALVTGWGDGVDPETMAAAGVDAVVAKPFTIEDIMRAVGLAATARRRAA